MGQKQRLDFVDGLRAVCALWVLLAHAQMCNPNTAGGLLAANHFAVTVFIVISGFCLMLPVARESSPTQNGPRCPALRFYVGRCRRILPPYFAALVLSVMFSWVAEPHGSGFARDLLSHAFLLQDVWGNAYNFDAPMWSIALEWHIYAVFPLYVLAWGRFGALRTVCFALALAYAWPALRQAAILLLALCGVFPDWYVPVPISQHYFGLFTVGMAAAWVAAAPLADGWRRWPYYGRCACALGGVLPLLGIYAGTEFFQAHMLEADGAVAALAALFLLSSALGQGGPVCHLLSTRPLVALGGFSYSLYLVHYPILLLWHNHVLPRLHLRGDDGYRLTVYLIVPAIIAGAYAFYLCFERPTLRRRNLRAKEAGVKPNRGGPVETAGNPEKRS